MDLDNIMLNEINHTDEGIYLMISLISRNYKSKQTNKKQSADSQTQRTDW